MTTVTTKTASQQQETPPQWPHLAPRNEWGLPDIIVHAAFLDLNSFTLDAWMAAAGGAAGLEGDRAKARIGRHLGREYLVLQTTAGHIALEASHNCSDATYRYSLASTLDLGASEEDPYERDSDEADDLRRSVYFRFFELLKEQSDADPGARCLRTKDPPWNLRRATPGNETSEEHPGPAELAAEGKGLTLAETADLQAWIISEALEKASGESPTFHRTRDPLIYRAWELRTRHGSVFTNDLGNCWTAITELDLEPAVRESFCRELVRLVVENPREAL